MPEIEKNYKQEFEKKQGEHSTPVIVVTEPHSKRSNVDEIEEPGKPTPPPTPEYELTAEKLAAVLKGSQTIVIDEPEVADGKLYAKIDEEIVDFILPQEVSPSKITHEVGDSNTIITTEAGVFDADNGYHVYLEIEGSGTHYGADFTVFPYNQSTCLTVFNMVIENGGVSSVKECYGSLNEQGQLVIDLPIVMTPESQNTVIHFKRII